jgi:hypothetical protein
MLEEAIKCRRGSCICPTPKKYTCNPQHQTSNIKHQTSNIKHQKTSPPACRVKLILLSETVARVVVKRRLIAVEGICRVTALYWELIPVSAVAFSLDVSSATLDPLLQIPTVAPALSVASASAFHTAAPAGGGGCEPLEPPKVWEIADSYQYFISKMSRMTHRRSRLENCRGEPLVRHNCLAFAAITDVHDVCSIIVAA